MVAGQLILKKFAICQGRKLLTEFDVLIFAEMITPFIKSHIFGVGKPASKIFRFNHGYGLRCISVPLIFLLAGFQLRIICVPAVELCVSPRVGLIFYRFF